jgi:drug/metabolite transporter (DMT)-like permease
MKPSYLIFLLLANLAWGGVYSAYKVLGQYLTVGGIVTLRFTLASLCFLVIWPFVRGPGPRGRDLLNACLMGVLHFALGQRLQVWATQLGTASNSAILMALEPLLTSVAAAVFLHERLGPRRLAGFALGICGVALLNRVWRSDFQWAGLVPSLIFLSSFGCETAYSILGKPIVARASGAKTVAVSLWAGTALNLLLDGPQTFRAATTLPLQAWGLFLGLAVICTVIGYTLWLVVIRDCPVNVAALTIFAQSVFGVIIAALWVNETLHWGHLFGSLTIAAGLALGLSRQIHRACGNESSARTAT